MEQVGYYNGEVGPLDQIKVPLLDRAMFFGDGCYDATTFKYNRIFAEEEHFDRFYHSCELLDIPFAMSREELHAELMRVIDGNECDHGMLYWQCSRGTGPRQHQYCDANYTPNLAAFTVKLDLLPMDLEFRLVSEPDNRFYMCNIKTINLLPSVLAYDKAVRSGCHETVLYRHEYGRTRVTECAHSNVLIIRDGTLVAPPQDNLILPGITMRHNLMLARRLGIPTAETPFTLDELAAADEVIVTSSGGLCSRAVELDGRPIGRRDPQTLKALQDAYVAYYEERVSG